MIWTVKPKEKKKYKVGDVIPWKKTFAFFPTLIDVLPGDVRQYAWLEFIEVEMTLHQGGCTGLYDFQMPYTFWSKRYRLIVD